MLKAPKIRTSIFLTKVQLKALRARQVKTGVTVAEQIRRILDAALKGKS